jgi:hypothetical protein
VFFLKPGLIVEENQSCGRADIRDVLIRQDELQRWRNSRPIIVVFRILQRTDRQSVSQTESILTADIAIHKPNKQIKSRTGFLEWVFYVSRSMLSMRTARSQKRDAGTVCMAL